MLFANLINVIIWLVIIGVCWYVVGLIPLPPVIAQLIMIAFIILAVVVVLSLFGVFNIGVPRLYK